MNDKELGDLLKTAFEPYVRGFCKNPSDASVAVTVVDERIDADVTLGALDFKTIAVDVHVARAVKDAFGALCRQNDLTRGSTLVFRRGG